MIDLRSDTVTMPSREMLETALWARLGDDGRRRADRTGGDPTVDRLEQLAAGLTGKEMERRLDEVNITVNKNAIPNDPEKPFVTSGIRVGTPAATTRGFVEEDMKVIARLMWETATDFDNKAESVREQVAQLTGKYPLYS